MTEVSRPPEYARTQEVIRTPDVGCRERGKFGEPASAGGAKRHDPPIVVRIISSGKSPLCNHRSSHHRGSSTARILRNKKSVVASCPCSAIAPPASRRPSRAFSFGGRVS